MGELNIYIFFENAVSSSSVVKRSEAVPIELKLPVQILSTSMIFIFLFLAATLPAYNKHSRSTEELRNDFPQTGRAKVGARD